ncbi:MAG: radical SAM protein [Syntrophobacteraceae bacterium]|nr:radical SAM protein [Desulfobacteraceae bacterium]
MLLKCRRGSRGKRPICLVCGKPLEGTGGSLEVCPECLLSDRGDGRVRLEAIHAASRHIFGLPVEPPRSPGGLSCNLCVHQCKMWDSEPGYCGVRHGGRDSMRLDGRARARVSYYYDPLPTNCVADWVCPGGTGAGYPQFSHDRCTEAGFFNLAVFFEACNFNCLYCQNWVYKQSNCGPTYLLSVDGLAGAVNRQTSCICFFGGDPVPQLPYALRVAEEARRRNAGRILRICWETNGSARPAWLKRMVRASLDSGGCVKMDLKAWDPRIHRALCGFDNRQVLENFARLAEWVPLRPDPPLLVASTLLVPGYVGDEEVSRLAGFIAGLNPDIPYTLLAFTPQFCLEDFPTTSRADAEACLEAAKRAGLRRVRLANAHFIH